jgi:hypothetical protein
MIQQLMGAATSSNTNLLEGGVIVMGVAMLLREILPPIVKIAKKDDSNKESPIQSNGYLKRTEFDKFTDKVQYRTECDVISSNIKEGLRKQEERMEKMDIKMDSHFNDLKTILKGKT